MEKIYTKTKFRFTGTYRRGIHYDEHNQAYMSTDKVFIPTRGYKKWLDEKRKAEFEEELRILRQKLDMEYQLYGEVDTLDYQEYIARLTQYNKIFG